MRLFNHNFRCVFLRNNNVDTGLCRGFEVVETTLEDHNAGDVDNTDDVVGGSIHAINCRVIGSLEGDYKTPGGFTCFSIKCIFRFGEIGRSQMSYFTLPST